MGLWGVIVWVGPGHFVMGEECCILTGFFLVERRLKLKLLKSFWHVQRDATRRNAKACSESRRSKVRQKLSDITPRGHGLSCVSSVDQKEHQEKEMGGSTHAHLPSFIRQLQHILFHLKWEPKL